MLSVRRLKHLKIKFVQYSKKLDEYASILKVCIALFKRPQALSYDQACF